MQLLGWTIPFDGQMENGGLGTIVKGAGVFPKFRSIIRLSEPILTAVVGSLILSGKSSRGLGPIAAHKKLFNRFR